MREDEREWIGSYLSIPIPIPQTRSLANLPNSQAKSQDRRQIANNIGARVQNSTLGQIFLEGNDLAT